MTDVQIQIRPASDVPAFGAYIAPIGDFESPAMIVINIAAHLAAVAEGDMTKDELHAAIMETIFHEIGHVVEHWIGVEFSEDRVEALAAEYAGKAEVIG